jgi:hypothetical protein
MVLIELALLKGRLPIILEKSSGSGTFDCGREKLQIKLLIILFFDEHLISHIKEVIHPPLEEVLLRLPFIQ